MATSTAVGIDLGTTYSCVGVFQNGKVEIIANGSGERTTPSVVGFSNDRLRYVGQYPKDRMSKMPQNTIFCVKRMMGKQFDDPQLQEDMKEFPFKVVNNDGKAAVEVEVNQEKLIITPEEISALILNDLMITAKKYLGPDVKDAVITIPAYFNNAQRQATVDAGRIAGLNVLRIINEPTAAALAYAFKKNKKDETLLVYDMGGGTFDVSIIKIHDERCEVLAVAGDGHLGGEDFDNILVKYGIEEFKRKHGHDISSNPRAICRLKAVCESAKRFLSGSHFAQIEVDELFGGDDLNCKITVARFNELCKPLIEKTLGPIQRALDDAKLTKDDINEVLLVGGSTRIPFVQSTLKEFFDGKSLKTDINGDEAVAYGATLLAASLAQDFDTSIRKIRLLDVTPHSLGVDSIKNGVNETVDGYFSAIVARNTKIPCEGAKSYLTVHDNQKDLLISVYEGEDRLVKNNVILGSFKFDNIAPGPKYTKINLTFKIDENGILKVSACDPRDGNSESIEILPDTGSLNEEKLIQMINKVNPTPVVIEMDLE